MSLKSTSHFQFIHWFTSLISLVRYLFCCCCYTADFKGLSDLESHGTCLRSVLPIWGGVIYFKITLCIFEHKCGIIPIIWCRGLIAHDVFPQWRQILLTRLPQSLLHLHHDITDTISPCLWVGKWQSIKLQILAQPCQVYDTTGESVWPLSVSVISTVRRCPSLALSPSHTVVLNGSSM